MENETVDALSVGQSISGDLFVGVKPRIEELGDHEFKYRVDFDGVAVSAAVRSAELVRIRFVQSNAAVRRDLP